VISKYPSSSFVYPSFESSSSFTYFIAAEESLKLSVIAATAQPSSDLILIAFSIRFLASCGTIYLVFVTEQTL
jgi:hypothetical protein